MTLGEKGASIDLEKVNSVVPHQLPPDPQPSQELSQETLSGNIERVTYHNETTGFCVLRIKISGKRDLLTVIGTTADVRAGEYIQAQGVWINDKDHGMQFKATSLTLATPSSAYGLEKYLGSGLIKGVGKYFATKLVQHFGVKVVEVIDKTPEKLMQIEGIGKKRFAMITGSWSQQKTVREIMVFLSSHGVGTAKAFRIYKVYGDQAIVVVKDNPYRLAQDVKGIGFKTADQIAATLHIDKTSMQRARAGITHVLQEALSEGHCALPRNTLLTQGQELLEIPQEILEQALVLEEESVTATEIEGRPCIALSGLYAQEKFVATHLKALANKSPLWKVKDLKAALRWAEQQSTFPLSESQRNALEKVLSSSVCVITGGPGVGKTTILKALIQILQAKNVNILLAAPTGRAAKKMSESTGTKAKTIHRLLQFDPASGSFKYNEHTPLKCDVLILDEVSMVDVLLMYSLLKALPHQGLILVGDVDQLPSVGPGQILADVIASGVLPVAKLTQVFRQARHSRIITNAHRVNQGHMPVLTHDSEEETDFYFIEAKDPETAKLKIMKVVSERLPQTFGFHPMKDIQVLCPMNRSSTGARTLNIDLQSVLNPLSPDQRLERFGFTYGVRDKVMQTENNYDKNVFNGDIGYIQQINREDQELTIMFENQACVYDFNELDQVSLAYAMTIHKSQGSEYPAIVMPFMSQHFMMLKRNLLYTGMTRGKKMVVLIGQKQAIYMAVNSKKQDKRWSKLKEWLV